MTKNKEQEKDKDDVEIDNKYVVYGSAAVCVISCIVWILAMLWHPFGVPLLQWHVINGVITFGSFIILLMATFQKK